MVERKGIGYMIEAFAAVIILMVFAAGGMQTEIKTQDWNKYQTRIGAQDLTYVMTEDGTLDRTLNASRASSLETISKGLSNGNLEVSGTVEGLPVDEKNIGFYAPAEKTTVVENLEEVSGGDQCYGDLGEIESEYPVLKIPETSDLYKRHETMVYIADEDPTYPEDFNDEEDYDTIWVDNGTRCQFSASEGPIREEAFFRLGDENNPLAETFYDLDTLQDEGEYMKIYNTTQVLRFRDSMDKGVDGINTDTHLDAFNLSDEITEFDVTVFRDRGNLDTVNRSYPGKLKNYLQDGGSVLLLMELREEDMDYPLLNESGLEWVPESSSSNGGKGVQFSTTDVADRVKIYAEGSGSDTSNITLGPQGKINSSINLTDQVPGPRIIASYPYITYSDGSQVEAINYRPRFENSGSGRLARMGYMEHYPDDDRKLVEGVIYWLSEDSYSFGEEQSPVSTRAISGIKNEQYFPYTANLRWNR